MMSLEFWKKKRSFLSICFIPISWLYILGFIINKQIKYPKKIGIPVICLGNLTVGGSGKTPISLSLGDLLKKHGYNPFFLTRGYKGKIKGIKVDREHHKAQEVGDEAILLSKIAPTIVDRNRYKGALKAISYGSDIIIMDDGFQNYDLCKDKSFLVFDGTYGIGNGRILPSGPLRECFREGLSRASGIIIVGEDKFKISNKIKKIKPTIEIFNCIVIPNEEVISALKGKKVLAFAGIGNPQKFFSMLKSYGVDVIKEKSFPDHYQYKEKDIIKLKDEAIRLNAILVTTEKDKVKLSSFDKGDIISVPVNISWQDEAKILDFLISHD